MSTDGEKRPYFSRLVNAQGSRRLGPKYRLSNRVHSARTGQPLTAAYLFAPNSYRIAKLVGNAGYHKVGHDAAAIETGFADLFLDASGAKPPPEIILDLDATDDPTHGHQEGRFFHGYYDCSCSLPLYIFCGRHLLAAKLRRSNIDASAGAVEEVQRIAGRI